MTLTQEALKKVLNYNPESGQFTWLDTRHNAVKVGDIAGHTCTSPGGKSYVYITVNGKSYLAHRLAVLYQTGRFPVNEVDHIYGNGIDNRWDMLREATRKENSKNQRLLSSNTSGFSGVFFDKHSGKWRAAIRVDGMRKYLGSFPTINMAISAKKAANIEFGFHPNHGLSRPL